MFTLFKKIVSSIIPKSVLKRLLPIYHRTLPALAAFWYRFPSRKLIVIGVTGTKGKTTTVELIASIFEAGGYKVALSNSVRQKIGHKEASKKTSNSMPGRFATQRFFANALKENCDVVVLEMTSEAARQHRHTFIALDAFIFLNIAPEHIESHGSFENYLFAKRALADSLSKSVKRPRTLLVNRDYRESKVFRDVKCEDVYTFSKKDARGLSATDDGLVARVGDVHVSVPLIGAFNITNVVAAIAVAHVFDISSERIATGLKHFKGVPGRTQRIDEGQPFDVYVDYAHTPDSLEAVLQNFRGRNIILVFGSCGGGRDVWKRKAMGSIADKYARDIILTNEDPYDEDPEQIAKAIQKGIEHTSTDTIINRREAISAAFSRATPGSVVIMTGKGSEKSIHVENGKEIPWSDAKAAREELRRLMKTSTTKDLKSKA